MTPHTTWILVAHRGGAVLFEGRGPGLPLARIARIPNPDGRRKAVELGSDRPGRAFDRKGGGRHSHATEESMPEHVEATFVSDLVERLERGRAQAAFDRLVLIAPAKTLGKLRDALSPPLAALLVASLSKDLAHSDAEQVRKQLFDLALV